jgi:hypothetical protein
MRSEGETRWRTRVAMPLLMSMRGARTYFDSNPKVGPVYVDLLKLYKRVMRDGGYDKVSDTKSNKLAWRRLAVDFLPPNSNIVQLAFQLKTVYYKYLAYVTRQLGENPVGVGNGKN